MPVLGLDIRALGAFRIVVGLNLLYNLLRYRLPYVEGFYAGERIVPPDVVEALYGRFPSVLDLTGSVAGTTVLLWVLVAVAALYTIGWRPVLTGAISLVGLLSVIHANPLAAHGVEAFIEVSLFWGLFLPLDATFSAFPRRRADDAPAEVRGLPVAALLFQIAMIYLTSALTKNGDMWRGGVAIWAALEDRTHAGMLAGLMHGFPGLCRLLTYASIVLEAALPLLIFSPVRSAACRLFAGVSIFWFHVLLGTVLVVGPFWMITAGFAVVLMPSAVWDRLGVPVDANARPARPAAPRFDAVTHRRLRAAIGVVLVAVMLYHTQKNLSRWREHSYASGLIRAVPPLDRLATLPMPRLGVSGIAEQPWWLFAPDPYPEMGTFVFVGMGSDGRFLDLLADEEVLELDPRTGEIRVTGSVWNRFTGSRFVLSFYARRFLTGPPGELFANWTRYEYERWARRHPGETLRRCGLVYVANTTRYEGGRIRRTGGARFVGSYTP